MFFSLHQVINILEIYKYAVLFPIVVIEGPIVTVVSGFLVYSGFLNMFITYPLVVVADVIGDCLYYAVGRFGRKKYVDRLGSFWGITPERIIKAEKYFEKHGGKTLVMGKFAPGPGGAALVAAGVINMSFLKFFSYSFFGTLVKSFGLMLIGYYFGNALEKINSYFGMLEAIFTAVFVLIIIFLAIRHQYKKYKEII